MEIIFHEKTCAKCVYMTNYLYDLFFTLFLSEFAVFHILFSLIPHNNAEWKYMYVVLQAANGVDIFRWKGGSKSWKQKVEAK